jgi:hypothetical protein
VTARPAGHAAERAAGRDVEAAGVLHDRAEVGEVLQAVARLALDGDGLQAGRDDGADRVPVRRRLRHRRVADLGAGAGAVDDDEARAGQAPLEIPRHGKDVDVGPAARREGDDDLDRPLGRPGGRLLRARGRRRAERATGDSGPSADGEQATTRESQAALLPSPDPPAWQRARASERG